MSEIYLHLDDEEQLVLRTTIGTTLGEPMPDLGLIDKREVLARVRRNITDLQMMNALPDLGSPEWSRTSTDLDEVQERMNDVDVFLRIASTGFRRAQEALDEAVKRERKKHGKSEV